MTDQMSEQSKLEKMESFEQWLESRKPKRRWQPRMCPDCGVRMTGSHVCDDSAYKASRGVCPSCWLEYPLSGVCGECDS